MQQDKIAFELFLRRGIHIDELEAEQKAEPHPAFVENSEHHSTPYYIWRTQGDSRVRSRHAERNGKVFSWDDPPEGGHPGEDYNCRCWAEPYHGPATDGIEDLNAETIAAVVALSLRLPQAAAGLVARALRALQAARREAERQSSARQEAENLAEQARREEAAKEWVLLRSKGRVKWENRKRDGDWTDEQITETLLYGRAEKVENLIKPDNTSTQYHWNGKFLVADDVTQEIMQLSKPGMKPNAPIQ